MLNLNIYLMPQDNMRYIPIEIQKKQNTIQQVKYSQLLHALFGEGKLLGDGFGLKVNQQR